MAADEGHGLLNLLDSESVGANISEDELTLFLRDSTFPEEPPCLDLLWQLGDLKATFSPGVFIDIVLQCLTSFPLEAIEILLKIIWKLCEWVVLESPIQAGQYFVHCSF